jgi:hypothetical protein
MIGRIYILIDPRDNLPKYVGQTTVKLYDRLSTHMNKKKLEPNNKKNAWFKHLISLGMKPSIELLEEVEFDTYDQLDLIETMWIGLFRSWGFDLKNGTIGGKQGRRVNKIIITPERIEKQRATLLEGYRTGRIINANKGKKDSEATRLKKLKTSIEKVIKPESHKKRGETQRGMKKPRKKNNESISSTI